MLTGLLAIKMNINLTNIEHLCIKEIDFTDAVSKGFIEKTYVIGPINFSPQKIEKLWKLTKTSAEKKKMNKKRNKNSTLITETTTIVSHQQITVSTNYSKDEQEGKFTERIATIHHESPKFKTNEKRNVEPSDIPNLTTTPDFILGQEGKDTARYKTVRIKSGNFKTLTEPFKDKQSEGTAMDSMDIYVPIRKSDLPKFKRQTNNRKTKMSSLGSVSNKKVNK